MKRPHFLLFFIVIPIFNSFAQDIQMEGFIVLQSGDTVRGVIKDMEWFQPPTSVEFKENNESTFKTFGINDIKAFATARPVNYELQTFKYDGDMLGKKVGDYPTSRLPQNWIRQTAFVEVITKSNLSLYNFTDGDGQNHFLIKEKDSVTARELIHRKYVSIINRVPEIKESEEFKQQLVNHAAGCNSLTNRIKTLRYDDGALKNFIQEINACKGHKIEKLNRFKRQIKKPKIGFIAQVQSNHPNEDWVILDNKKLTFSGGLTYEIFSRKRPNRISLYNELKYYSFNQDGLEYYWFTGKYIFPSHYSYRSVKMMNSFRSTFGKRANIYGNFGIVWGLCLKADYKYSDSKNDYNLKSGKAFESGLAFGVGKKFPKLHSSVEFRYEFIQILGIDGLIPNRIRTTALVVGFQL